eukprot:CAMPEP_0177657230 /NCGR_PEP_ID=MMETSP0447-20121125/16065_1 /TAXON_ID=0 /ORGANISM="Stygamoeba regulata, Strain BSH-02190019" /LENGTH=137 /DNA_ID=CAMNT_0019161553 /DNA_START=49 /DNA_END=462 /DNA_ORIENTATION=+
MSSDLVWQIVRNNNSFLVKRNGIQLSREKNNLRNVNSYKYSGLANAKSVGVQAGAKGVVLTKRSRRHARKPAKSFPAMPLTGTFRQNAKVIKSETSGKHYRPDLEKAALARMTRVAESLKPVKAINKRPKNRANRKK